MGWGRLPGDEATTRRGERARVDAWPGGRPHALSVGIGAWELELLLVVTRAEGRLTSI